MSINDLLTQIAYLKEFIVLTVIATFAITLYFGIINRKYSRKKYGSSIYSLFFKLDRLSRLRIALFYLMFIYIISCIIRFQPILYIHVYCFIILAIGNVIVNYKSIKVALFTLLNICIDGGMLFILNILVNYLFNIRFNVFYLIIYILASVAMVMYSSYVLLYQILNISQGRKINEK